jgi:hypothetical protein
MADQTNNPATEPPPDWAEDWGRIPYDPNTERAAFNLTSSGPSSAIPKDYSQPSPPPRSSGAVGSPIAPPPGIDWVDKICIAADQREREQAAAPDAMMAQMAQALAMMQTTQTQMVTALAALVQRMEDKPKRKSKSQPPSAEGET